MRVGSELNILRALASSGNERGVRTGFALHDSAGSFVARDNDGVANITGDLHRFVANFVDTSPKRDSNGYRPIDTAERAAISDAWALLRDGDIKEAARMLEPTDMRVVRFTDVSGDNRVHSAMLEIPGANAEPRGLGLYIARDNSPADALHVQVPHPWDDTLTDAMGTEIFRQTDAATLAIAGASRHSNGPYSSDAAHLRSTLFHRLADDTAVEGANLLQLHGYRKTSHPGYGEAVVSTGVAPTEKAAALRSALKSEGIDTRLAGDKRPYANLAGARNVQGHDARAKGADWLHVEVADTVRLDPARHADAVRGFIEGTRR